MRMEHTINWKHKNGFDEIITDPSGNTIIGKKAHDLYFSVQNNMRSGEFSEMEFDNHLLIALSKDKNFVQNPNKDISYIEDDLCGTINNKKE